MFKCFKRCSISWFLLLFLPILGSRRFWPAKAMKIHENLINVEYFGDHTQDDIDPNSCILYTSHSTNFRKSTPFNDAILVRMIDFYFNCRLSTLFKDFISIFERFLL